MNHHSFNPTKLDGVVDRLLLILLLLTPIFGNAEVAEQTSECFPIAASTLHGDGGDLDGQTIGQYLRSQGKIKSTEDIGSTILFRDYVSHGEERLTFDGATYLLARPTEVGSVVYVNVDSFVPEILIPYGDGETSAFVRVSVDSYQSVDTLHSDIEIWGCFPRLERQMSQVEVEQSFQKGFKAGQAIGRYITEMQTIFGEQ